MGQTNINVPNNAGDGSQGMGAGMIVGLVLALVIIGFVVWYFLLNGGGGTTTPSTVPSVEDVLPSAALLRFLG